MNLKIFLAFIMMFILILPSISLNASSQSGKENNNPSNLNLVDILLRLRFQLGYFENLYMGRYYVRQLRPPVSLQAYPSSVSLRYLNETVFEIGGKNENETDWAQMLKVAGGLDWAWMSTRIQFYFEFVPPDNSSMDVWNVQFDPEYLVMDTNKDNMNWPGADTPFKTNVTIMLKPSADPRLVTQDVVLKINIIREEVMDKLGLLSAPRYPINDRDEYLKKVTEMGMKTPYWKPKYMVFLYNLILKYPIFIMNFALPNYEKRIESTVEILIKVDEYHLAEIKAPLPIKIEPYQVKSIPVTITNIGSHIDTYNFKVRCNDENMIVTPPPTLTLKPGEEGQALVGVAAPREFLSVGSTTTIFVEAYSVDDPDTLFSNTIILTRSGIHTPAGAIYNSVIFLIGLLVVIFLFMYLINKYHEKICKKPDKPWKIPEEKEYLKSLDGDEYKKIMEMMKDEYESALLWYKHFIQAIIEKKKVEEKQQKIEEKEKRIEEKEKRIEEKAKKLETKKEEKKEKIIPTKKEKIPKIKEKIPKEIKKEPEKSLKEIEAEQEELRKERAIIRIKREQEAQKRKLA